MKKKQERLKLLFTIVPRKMGAKYRSLYESIGIGFQTVLLGRGTATSDVLNLFGLDEPEKDIVLTIVPEHLAPLCFQALQGEYDIKGKGIAFSVPLSSIAGKSAYQFVKGVSGRE